ncbi:MAG TPA: hypothetical protein VH814_07225 [Steroidobacteraceae bacterium]|jgi:hypothetical protein
MNQDCGRRDLLGSGIAPWLLWVLPIATIALTGQFADREWILTVSWTLALVVMGVGCFANARRCGRTHCYFTAPFFLLMALASLLHGLGIVPLGAHGWSYIGIMLLIGGTLLCLLTESLWGRYRT